MVGLGKSEPDVAVEVDVLRDGKKITLEVKPWGKK